MPRTFAHVRVSTLGQTVENQIREITAAGFAVEPHRVVAETAPGFEAIGRRREFGRMLDRLERRDVLWSRGWTGRVATRSMWRALWRGWRGWACGCIAWRSGAST